MSEINNTLVERNAKYGAFLDQSQVSMELKELLHKHLLEHDAELASDQLEALEMICMKISRIIVGDPDYVDNWHDIAGYALLVARRLADDQD